MSTPDHVAVFTPSPRSKYETWRLLNSGRGKFLIVCALISPVWEGIASVRLRTAGNKLNHLWAVVRNDKFAFTSRPIPTTSFCVVSVSWWETVRKQLLEKQSSSQSTVIFSVLQTKVLWIIESFFTDGFNSTSISNFLHIVQKISDIKSTWVNFH